MSYCERCAEIQRELDELKLAIDLAAKKIHLATFDGTVSTIIFSEINDAVNELQAAAVLKPASATK